MIKIILNRGFIVFIFLIFIILLEPLIKFAKYHSHIINSGQIKYFREGNVSPQRWVIGYLANKYFHVIKRYQGHDERLDKVNIYFQESKLNKLAKDAPSEHRKWKKGFLLNKNQEIQNIRFRLRGDNARNFAFRKKSYKIKSRKNQLLNKYREIYYINPYHINIIDNYVPFLFAEHLNILNPFSRIVELHINDEYQGVYLEVFATDELFLRNKNLMPTSIFKHSIDLGYKFSSPDQTAFMNGNLFFKQSKNNFDLEDERFLLNKFLKEADNDINNNFTKFLSIDDWANYSVYRILSGDFHSNGVNNLKFNADNHKGKIQNIVWDPITNVEHFTYKDDSFLTYCLNIIECRLNAESLFRYKKLKLLHEHISKKNTIEKVKKEIQLNQKKITNSLIKDKNRLDLILNSNDFLREFFKPNESINKEFDKIFNFLSLNEKFLKNLYNKNVNAKWVQKKASFDLYIDGFKPITSLKIRSDQNIENIYYDMNNNGIIDKNDKKIKVDYLDKSNNVKILLFSELKCSALVISENCSAKDSFTFSKHPFLFEKNIKINDISIFDEFTQKNYSIEKVRKFEKKNIFNSNNINIEKSENKLEINTDQYIYEDKIYNEEVKIKPGVKFFIDNNKSLIFKNKVEMAGTKDNPIVFKNLKKGKFFGTIALLGKNTKYSSLKNILIENGSGSINLEGITFISMLSIHDTEDINLEEIKLKNNFKYDDLIHIIYSQNISLKKINVSNALSDAIDIDISKVNISDLVVKNAKNDCLDLMMSEVNMQNSKLLNCGDKGISVGENSKINIQNSSIKNSNIGLAAKDNSKINGKNMTFKNNNTQIDSYYKNWQYGQLPSKVSIIDSNFSLGNMKSNIFKASDDNSITLKNVLINGEINKNKNVTISN